MLKDDEMWDDPANDPPEPYWDSNGLHEDNYGRITKRPREEQLEGLADMGIDTWDEYNDYMG